MTDHIVDINKKVLSPGAQEVLDAVRFEVNAECHAPWIAAAAIRALVDQVVPVWKTPPSGEYELEYGQWIAQNRIRAHILTIAAELENQ